MSISDIKVRGWMKERWQRPKKDIVSIWKKQVRMPARPVSGNQTDVFHLIYPAEQIAEEASRTIGTKYSFS